MTISGLCNFLDISAQRWYKWRQDRDDLRDVIARVEQIISTQKFEGAAADLLNHNIISRELGLADRRELSGPGGGPVQIVITPVPAGVFFEPQEKTDE